MIVDRDPAASAAKLFDTIQRKGEVALRVLQGIRRARYELVLFDERVWDWVDVIGPSGYLTLAALESFRRGDKCSPSIQMLSDRTKLAKRQIQYHLRTLESLGFIEREERPGQSNLYRIMPTNAQ